MIVTCIKNVARGKQGHAHVKDFLQQILTLVIQKKKQPHMTYSEIKKFVSFHEKQPHISGNQLNKLHTVLGKKTDVHN